MLQWWALPFLLVLFSGTTLPTTNPRAGASELNVGVTLFAKEAVVTPGLHSSSNQLEFVVVVNNWSRDAVPIQDWPHVSFAHAGGQVEHNYIAGQLTVVLQMQTDYVIPEEIQHFAGIWAVRPHAATLSGWATYTHVVPPIGASIFRPGIVHCRALVYEGDRVVAESNPWDITVRPQ